MGFDITNIMGFIKVAIFIMIFKEIFGIGYQNIKKFKVSGKFINNMTIYWKIEY